MPTIDHVRGPDWDKSLMRFVVRWKEDGKGHAKTFETEDAAKEKRAELDEATPKPKVDLPPLRRGFQATAADAKKYARDLAVALWKAIQEGDNGKVNLLGKAARASSEIFDLAFTAHGYQEVVDELPEVEKWADAIAEGRAHAAEKPEAVETFASALKTKKKRLQAVP